jgi:transcription elongation factor SPT6
VRVLVGSTFHVYVPVIYTDPLDDTRVHPDDYEFARKMTADALESHEDQEQWQFLVVDLMEDPKKEKKLGEIGTICIRLFALFTHVLATLDLDTFAEEWERSGKGKKLKALYDIRRELIHPFKDIRDKFRDPTEDELFTMLTGETDKTFFPGLLVTVVVSRVTSSKVYCKLENGVFGIIDAAYVSDQPGVKVDEVIVPSAYFFFQVLSHSHGLNYKYRSNVDMSCDVSGQGQIYCNSLLPRQ